MKRCVYHLLAILVLITLIFTACSPADKQDTSSSDGGTTSTPADSKSDTENTDKAIDYPTRDIQWIVPYPSGSATDLPARVFQKHFNKALGGNTVITNMPGSAGTVAATEMLNRKPDGYTISSFQPSILIPHILGSFDHTYEDYEVICQYGVINHGIVVRADSPYYTLDDIIKAANENPGKLKLGGSFNHVQQICLLELKKLSGADFNIVEIGGTAIKAPELLSGRVDAYVDAFSAAASYIQSGEFRCIAVFANERDPFFPDVPTAKESGYDISYEFSMGLMAPKGTPKEIIAKLEAATKETCENPEYAEDLKALYTNPYFLSGEDYVKYHDDVKVRLEAALKELQ